MMLSKEFAYLLKKFGRLDGKSQLDQATVMAFRGRLPDSLIDFWSDQGIGAWQEGRFQFCTPKFLEPVISQVFQGDADLQPQQTFAYGYSALGKIFIWNTKYFGAELDLDYLKIDCAALVSEKQRETEIKLGPDRTVATNLASLDQIAYDGVDTDGKPIFNRALKTLGKLDIGERYGFVPALALGGQAKLENLQRLKALEHFSILAGLGRVNLVDYSTGRQRFVRKIGPQ